MELWGLTGSGLVIPKFSAPPSGETVRQTGKSFRGAKTCSRSSITVLSSVGLGFHSPSGRPKTLNFLSVCLSVCLSVRHAFERQRFCARFRHEGVEYRNDFDDVGQEKVCGAASVFNFLTLPPTVDITKCRSPKTGKNWSFSPPEGDSKPFQTKFGT